MLEFNPIDKYFLNIHRILDNVYKKFDNNYENVTKNELTEIEFSRELKEEFEKNGFDVCYATHEKFLVFKNGFFFEGKYEPEFEFDPQDEYIISVWSTKRLIKVLTVKNDKSYDWYLRNWVREVIKKHYDVELNVKF